MYIAICKGERLSSQPSSPFLETSVADPISSPLKMGENSIFHPIFGRESKEKGHQFGKLLGSWRGGGARQFQKF